MKETYRNIFAEMGIAQQQIDKRLREIRDFYFDGKDGEFTERTTSVSITRWAMTWHISWTQETMTRARKACPTE